MDVRLRVLQGWVSAFGHLNVTFTFEAGGLAVVINGRVGGWGILC
jgi:hypothetical protein